MRRRVDTSMRRRADASTHRRVDVLAVAEDKYLGRILSHHSLCAFELDLNHLHNRGVLQHDILSLVVLHVEHVVVAACNGESEYLSSVILI